ncbi:MAG: nucleotide exchange factor GrpE, partial [Chloroflexota bacterium]
MTKDQGDIGAESADDQQVQQEPAGTPGDQQAETLQSQLEEEKARAERCLANWQRAEADLANFKRRAEQERAELIKFANASLIEKILPVLDDFERAIGAVPQDQQTTGWVEGIKLIDRKLR